jgi:tetratricopeptide (TPR) repeat protein
LLAQHTEPLQGSRPQVSVGTLEVEFDNLRLAWQTGVAGRKADRLATALTSLSLLYQLRGLAREGEAVMQATATSAATWGAAGSALATRAGLEQARFQNRLGRYWQATVTLATALRLAAQNGDRWAEAMGHVLWGEALWRLGEHEAARAKLAHALELGQMLDAQLIVGWCHHHFGIIDDIQGRYDAAHEHLQRACAAWQSLENASTLSVSLNSIGLVRHHQGDLAAAREIMEQALTLCTQIDNRHLQALLLNNLSMVATESGDYAGAQYYLQLGFELAVATGNRTGQGEIYTNLGRNYWLLGKTALAAENLEQGLRVAESLGNRLLIATTMLYLAQVRHAQGISETAEIFYNQALFIARQDALSHLECELLLGLADFLSATNRMQAQLYSLEARALAETIGNARLLERATAVAYELHLPLNATKQNLSA